MKRITCSMALVDGAGLWWPGIKIKPCSWLRKKWEGLGEHNQPDIAQSFSDLSRQRTQMPSPLPPDFLVCVGTINQKPARCLWSQVVWHHHTNLPPRFLDPGTWEKKNNSSVPCLVAGLGRTQPSAIWWPNQEPWCWVAGHHYGEKVQGREMEERARQTVHGLGREADLQRSWWWGTGWYEWPASHLSSRWCLGWG